MACCRSASVSASAGAAWSRWKISRACWRTGVASVGRAELARHRPWPRRANACFGHDSEPSPAIGGIGVAVGGGLQVPVGLAQGGVRCDEGMLRVRGAGFQPGYERLGECGLADRQRGAHHRGKQDAVVLGVAGARVWSRPRRGAPSRPRPVRVPARAKAAVPSVLTTSRASSVSRAADSSHVEHALTCAGLAPQDEDRGLRRCGARRGRTRRRSPLARGNLASARASASSCSPVSTSTSSVLCA